VPVDSDAAVSPGAVLSRDRRATFVITAVFGLGAGLVFWITFNTIPSPFFPVAIRAWVEPGLALGLGLLCGLLFSMLKTPWPSYALARAWMCLHHRLPWPLMRFLADAHQRGVLRQEGAVYQFRHIELQRRLAARP
jgi:hypothetical protein